MMKELALAGFLALMVLPPQADATEGKETYDLLFRNGTLDTIDPKMSLVYRRDVTNMIRPDAAERDTGGISLSVLPSDATMVQLKFRTDGKHRALGQFPASVGNPMIMYFYETVVRDMAESAGGSPFYIRNRVKEALTQPAAFEEGEAVIDGENIPTVTVRLKPFENDPNKDRMQGFGDLEMRVTMSEKVPGWYLSLVAETAPSSRTDAVYRSAVMFEGLEAAE
ncbi:MAG: hypothetical protein AAGA73_10015 [Pseudomonadota bacterium]